MMQRILTLLLLLFVGGCLGMMLTRSCQNQPKVPEAKIERDTTIIVQIDTQYFPKPVPYKVEVRDTIYINDTINGNIFVQETKEYKDSTYYAKISGINAYLEEIRVFPKNTTKYIYNTEIVREKPKKWGIGVQVGYGVGKNGIQPYIGMGIQYDLLRF